MGTTNIEYPCGMTIRTKTWYHYFGDEDMRKLYDWGCPLHGEKCKR